MFWCVWEARAICLVSVVLLRWVAQSFVRDVMGGTLGLVEGNFGINTIFVPGVSEKYRKIGHIRQILGHVGQILGHVGQILGHVGAGWSARGPVLEATRG